MPKRKLYGKREVDNFRRNLLLLLAWRTYCQGPKTNADLAKEIGVTERWLRRAISSGLKGSARSVPQVKLVERYFGLDHCGAYLWQDNIFALSTQQPVDRWSKQSSKETLESMASELNRVASSIEFFQRLGPMIQRFFVPIRPPMPVPDNGNDIRRLLGTASKAPPLVPRDEENRLDRILRAVSKQHGIQIADDADRESMTQELRSMIDQAQLPDDEDGNGILIDAFADMVKDAREKSKTDSR